MAAMRICFVHTIDFRTRFAFPLFVLKTIEAAVGLGHDAVLAVPGAGAPEEVRRDYDGALTDYGVSRRVPLALIPQPTLLGRGRRSFALLAALWARWRRFDLVWSGNIYTAEYTSMLGTPTILEHHTMLKRRHVTSIRRSARRSSFRAFVSISEAHKRIMTQEGVPTDKIVAAHSAVDLSNFPENGSSERSGPAKVVYCGSLYPGRGVDQVIQAASRLSDVDFTVVGGRDFEVARHQGQANALDLGNVHFTGYVPSPQVAGYLMDADVLVAPYTENAEALDGTRTLEYASPMKLLDYLASGKPIIASDIGAIPEIIRHGHNGLLVRPGSVDDLVQAIERVLRDKGLARRLGSAARQDAKGYTWEARVERILSHSGVS